VRVSAEKTERAPGDEGTARRTTAEIASAMLSVARVMSQVRTHDMLRKQANVGLDRGGAALLSKLFVEGQNIRLIDLADRLGIDPPAVTRKVQQLERAGLILRTTDPDDARACRLKLTRKGRSAIDRLLQAHEKWIDDLLRGWSQQDQEDFARLLRLFASTTEHDIETRHGH
jgi:DNA-binding MarR family transcriptional regulator